MNETSRGGWERYQQKQRTMNDAEHVLSILLSIMHRSARWYGAYEYVIEWCTDLPHDRVHAAFEALKRLKIVELKGVQVPVIKLVDKRLEALVHGIDKWGHINTEIVYFGSRGSVDTYRNPYYAQLMRQDEERKHKLATEIKKYYPEVAALAEKRREGQKLNEQTRLRDDVKVKLALHEERQAIIDDMHAQTRTWYPLCGSCSRDVCRRELDYVSTYDNEEHDTCTVCDAPATIGYYPNFVTAFVPTVQSALDKLNHPRKDIVVVNDHVFAAQCVDEVHGRFDVLPDAKGMFRVFDVGRDKIVERHLTKSQAYADAKERASIWPRLIIEWSSEAEMYVGRCPDLFLGGCHGTNKRKVPRELRQIVREWKVIDRVDRERAGTRKRRK